MSGDSIKDSLQYSEQGQSKGQAAVQWSGTVFRTVYREIWRRSSCLLRLSGCPVQIIVASLKCLVILMEIVSSRKPGMVIKFSTGVVERTSCAREINS